VGKRIAGPGALAETKPVVPLLPGKIAENKCGFVLPLRPAGQLSGPVKKLNKNEK
jgi:hypothetical protein